MNTHDHSAKKISLREFERLEALFDKAVEEFGRILAEPLENAFREQIGAFRKNTTATVASIMATETRAILHGLIDPSRMPDEEQEKALERFTHGLHQSLYRATADINDEAIAYEVESSSQELAEAVLSRWFEILAEQGPPPAGGVDLNGHLLPGCMTIGEAFAEVSFESYCVDQRIVAKALRIFWQSRLSDDEPAAFGDNLFIVPATGDAYPYRLFHDHGVARQFTRTHVPSRVLQASLFKNAYNIVHAVLTSTPEAPAADVPSLKALSIYFRLRKDLEGGHTDWEAWARSGHPGKGSPYMLQRPEQWQFNTRMIDPRIEKAFDWCCDQVIGVIGLPGAFAIGRLRERREQVMPTLREYSMEQRLKLDIVCEALALSVALYVQAALSHGEVSAADASRRKVIDDIRILRGRLPGSRTAPPRAKRDLTLETLASVAQRDIPQWPGADIPKTALPQAA